MPEIPEVPSRKEGRSKAIIRSNVRLEGKPVRPLGRMGLDDRGKEEKPSQKQKLVEEFGQFKETRGGESGKFLAGRLSRSISKHAPLALNYVLMVFVQKVGRDLGLAVT